MTILLITRADRAERWASELRAAAPGDEVIVWPEIGDTTAVEVIVTADPAPIECSDFPRLRFIATTGAGVDKLMAAGRGALPDVPIVRLVDDRLTESMAEYVLTAVLRYHRQLDHYEAAQREGRWAPLPRPEAAQTRVGILGLGVLGRATADLLRRHGFSVAGWSRSRKSIPDIECFDGAAGLSAMLAATSILVCLLPLTPETTGIIDARLLARLPSGARVVNVGRGGHVIDQDLLNALERGHIAHATLDVFSAEPLPSGHPFWRNRCITLTPHIASLTVPETAALRIAEVLALARRGLPLPNTADRDRGY